MLAEYHTIILFVYFFSVLRIDDILPRIRIRRSMPVTNGSESVSCISSFTFKTPAKQLIKKVCLSIAFWRYILHHFSKIKSQKEVTKQYEWRFFLLFFCLMIEGSGTAIPLTNGSGSRRPKNIRISNTASFVFIIYVFYFIFLHRPTNNRKQKNEKPMAMIPCCSLSTRIP